MLRKIMKVVRLTDSQIRDKARSMHMDNQSLLFLSPEMMSSVGGISSFIYDFMVGERDYYTFFNEEGLDNQLVKQCLSGLEYLRTHGKEIYEESVVVGDKSFMLSGVSRDSSFRSMPGEVLDEFGELILTAEDMYGGGFIDNELTIVNSISDLVGSIERDIVLAVFDSIIEDEVIIFPERETGAINLYIT